MRTDSFVPRIAALLTLSVAPFLLPGIASAQVPPPDWYHFNTPIPIEQGEFYIPGGTLGSLSIAIADNGIVGGALYFYSDTGELIVQAINGTLVRNDDDTVRETGEIAYVDLDTYALSNGPCRGCAYHARDQVQTSDVTHLAWVAPRTIEFTVNGMTETAVGLVNGPPLRPATDLSGTWVRVRYLYDAPWALLEQDPDLVPGHTESVDVVRIEPVPGPFSFRFATGDVHPPVIRPSDPRVLPPFAGGYDLYRVTCASPDCRLNFVTWTQFGATDQYLWIDAGNQGRQMAVRPTGPASGEVFDYFLEAARLYVSGDRIVGRTATYRHEPYYGYQETLMLRVPDGALLGDWEQSPCYSEDGVFPDPLPEPCNTP